jgi:hypothetical protein
MKSVRRSLLVVPAVVSMLALSHAVPAHAATITYSSTYLRLIERFPAGSADHCDISIFLAPAGQSVVCTDTLQTLYFYPDGTLGGTPWYEDAASPAGWSVAPDPCLALTGEDWILWITYLDFLYGYSDSGPTLGDAQVGLYAGCWGF